MTHAHQHHRLRGKRYRQWPSRLLAGIAMSAFVVGAGLVWNTAAMLADGPIQLAYAPTADPIATEENCVGCHQYDSQLSHPVNIIPSRAVPAGMPLKQGRMTCSTCHDATPGAVHAQLGRRGNFMLRQTASGQDFCRQCHRQTNAAHADATDRAHLQWPAKPRTASSSLLDEQRLDKESLYCLTCHDGSIATGVKIDRSDPVAGVHASNHPVGFAYRDHPGDLRSSKAPMKPVMMLDERIRLFDGNLGCGSCHSPYSQREKHLIMSNQESALCLSCHQM